MTIEEKIADLAEGGRQSAETPAVGRLAVLVLGFIALAMFLRKMGACTAQPARWP